MTPSLDTRGAKRIGRPPVPGGVSRLVRQILPLALLACVVAPAQAGTAAEDAAALAALPLADARLVPPADYQAASERAARGATPIEIALAVAGSFEGRVQWVIQTHDSAEAPTVTRVTLLREGLLDDAVRGERWDLVLRHSAAGRWTIHEVRRAWRCWCGAQSESFGAARCP